MREELLNELMVISEEEKKYRAGQGMVERQLYARESIGEIDRELLLKRGRRSRGIVIHQSRLPRFPTIRGEKYKGLPVGISVAGRVGRP